jgi:hypothetical protein
MHGALCSTAYNRLFNIIYGAVLDNIHTLAIQMGTSIAMIERHYSHLTPRLRKEMLTGKRYELSKEEFDEFTEIQ